MNIKKRDLLKLHNAITLLENKQYSVKFSYFIAKNKVTMRNEITALEQTNKADEEFQEYENKRIRLARQHADKDDDGSPKVQDSNFVLTTNMELFQKEFGELKEKYKDVIIKREKQLTEFEQFLEGDVEFEGMKINFKDIPQQNIEPVMMECLILADLIIEEK